MWQTKLPLSASFPFAASTAHGILICVERSIWHAGCMLLWMMLDAFSPSLPGQVFPSGRFGCSLWDFLLREDAILKISGCTSNAMCNYVQLRPKNYAHSTIIQQPKILYSCRPWPIAAQALEVGTKRQLYLQRHLHLQGVASVYPSGGGSQEATSLGASQQCTFKVLFNLFPVRSFLMASGSIW